MTVLESMTIGPVHWESYPGELFRSVMAVLLLQERPTSRHRRPSSGDGGVDVCEPTSDGYHVYQVKRYSKSLSPRNKKDIAESLKEVQINPRLNRRVSAWSLVIPLNPTSGDEEWFSKLTSEVEFPCDWLGYNFWQSESSKFPYVIDYFLESGKERLNQRVRTLAELLRNPSDSVRPADIVSSLSELHKELNSTDPFYSYDFKVTAVKPANDPRAILTTNIPVDDGTYVTVETYARFAQAVSDCPIGGAFTFKIFDETSNVDLRDDFRADRKSTRLN